MALLPDFGRKLLFEKNVNLNWLGDTSSVTTRGESVRDRHYVFFADWLTRQFKVFANAKGTRIDWKVNGTVDLSNARV